MALVNRDGQLSVSTGQQSTRESKRKRDVKVLDEETYVQSLNKIVQRDFFPELPKLRAQHEYLDAVEHNDVEKLREISARYQITQTPGGTMATPATFDTPSTIQGTPAPSETMTSNNRDTYGPPTGNHTADNKSESKCKKEDSDLTLDRFLVKNTSEDNASFEQIMDTAVQKHREKYKWLYEKETEQKERRETILALSAPEDGDQFKYEDRPSMIETWNYTNKNALMYYPDGVELSTKEKIEGKFTKRQQIQHENSRFKNNPFPDESCDDKLAAAAAAASRLSAKQGKVGVDGQVQGASETPKVNGFGFVATPSPAPGVDASPLMTWGSIEGTPFRLDGGDTPITATPGPTFKMPEPKKRDQLGHTLADRVNRKHRQKRRDALARATALIGRSPKHINTVDRLGQLSPAAQRLASQRLGIRTGTDKSLRASYTPSPSHQGSASSTPVHLHQPSPATPKGHSSTPAQTASLTDNLLKLPKH